MNDENTIEEYFSKLPNSVQECVLSDEWNRRYKEISAKYNLSVEQKSSLHLEVLLVVVGTENIEDFTENIETEVGVSGLLAGQLSEEINERLFLWIDKVYTSKNQLTPTSTTPEIMVNNLPMVEEGQVAHDVPRGNASGISVPRYIPPTNASVSKTASTPATTPATASVPVPPSPTPQSPVSPSSSLSRPTLVSEIDEQMAAMSEAAQPRESLADIALTRSPLRDTQSHVGQQSSQPASQSKLQTPSSQPSQSSQVSQSPSHLSSEKPSLGELRQKFESQQPQPSPTPAPDNLPGIEIIPDKKYSTDPYREPLE
jgi:hypothetical protein